MTKATNAHTDILDVISELKFKGEPFAMATVVRTVSVTSAKAGAKAIIMDDGSISEGWIGGGCARSAVLKAAREALKDGNPRLVSVQPEDLLTEQGIASGETKDGVKFATNMCPSQGTMDIFVEAVRPKPELVIYGSSPVAIALTVLAKPLGFTCTVCAKQKDHHAFLDVDNLISGFDLPLRDGSRFIVVSTQGSGDEAALKSALANSADYISFVGSHKKAARLQEKLVAAGMDESDFTQLKAPAGLDIKAVTPEEIALSILAEIIYKKRSKTATSSTELERDGTKHSKTSDTGQLSSAKNKTSKSTNQRHQEEINSFC
ncbi:MAG: XdhC family protein [Hyphomicrobiales bacterium]